ncbi:hypothetical protein DPSP01_010796 [Paraphaeosphaeria sporulosa]
MVRKMIYGAEHNSLPKEDAQPKERRHKKWKRAEPENDLIELFANVKCMFDISTYSNKELGARAVAALVAFAQTFPDVAENWKSGQDGENTTSPPSSPPSSAISWSDPCGPGPCGETMELTDTF